MKNRLLFLFFLLFLSIELSYSQTIVKAVREGNIQQAGQLLSENPELINAKDEYQNNLLFLAVNNRDTLMTELLLQTGIDVNYSRTDVASNALHTAVVMGPVKIVELLTDYGIDINKVNATGVSPLVNAALYGQDEIAEYLIGKGAEFTFHKSQTERILKSVLAGGNEKYIKLIEDFDTIDLFKCDLVGNSYLHYVAQGGLINFTGQLIRKGLDINKKNVFGWAPVHFAAYKGHTDIIKILMQSGAEKDIRTNDGKTAYNIAAEFNQSQVLPFLKNNGFDTLPPRLPEMCSKYVDPVVPDSIPRLFAPGIISQEYTFEHCKLTFSEDLTAVCWCDWSRNGFSRIFLMDKKDGKWNSPKVVVENATAPFISPDGQKIFVVASRILSTGGTSSDADIWYIEKSGDMWSDLIHIDSAVNTDGREIMPSVDKNGTLYFVLEGDIFHSKYVDGRYSAKEKLPFPINTANTESEPFISGDGSFLIFRSVGPEGMFAPNIRIAFHKTDGSWSDPANLSEKVCINGLFPSLTPDNKYLFYFQQDFYWVDAGIIENLRQEALRVDE